MEGLSDFVGSEKDDKEDVDAKPAGKASQRKQASQSNQHVKSVLQELEAESVTDEEGSVDSLLSDDEGERKVSSRAGIDKERQHFIYSRVKDMEEDEYRNFIQCRQTKFFSRGIQPILTWLQLRREGTELKDRKTLEMFGYILRTVLQRIVIEAVKFENDGELLIMKTAISIDSYKKAAANVCRDIIMSSEHWHDEIKACQIYIKEQGEDVDVAKVKERWDQLSLVEKSDFMCRVKAEVDFKEQLKKFRT